MTRPPLAPAPRDPDALGAGQGHARGGGGAPVQAPPPAHPPSADWRLDLAEGCPAHRSSCYLAGSLTGPPVTRAFANLPEVLGAVPAQRGEGAVTSRSQARAHEGAAVEASCYTEPLGVEHLTGSLAAAVAW